MDIKEPRRRCWGRCECCGEEERNRIKTIQKPKRRINISSTIKTTKWGSYRYQRLDACTPNAIDDLTLDNRHHPPPSIPISKCPSIRTSHVSPATIFYCKWSSDITNPRTLRQHFSHLASRWLLESWVQGNVKFNKVAWGWADTRRDIVFWVVDNATNNIRKQSIADTQCTRRG